jgi:hypothetical protein
VSVLTRRWRVAIGVLAVAPAIVVLGATTVGAKGAGRSTSGTIWIAATPRSSGALLYEAGQIKDKRLSEGAITFTIKPLVSPKGTITAKAIKVTWWTSTGSLSGTGSAQLTITNTPKPGDSVVKNGTVKLTQGTGGQKGRSLTATFTGSGNVNGALYTFHYKGTYK